MSDEATIPTPEQRYFFDTNGYLVLENFLAPDHVAALVHEVVPKGLSQDLVRKIMIDNPLATYGRLKQNVKEATP